MTHLYLTRSDIKLGFSQGQLVVKGSADEPERRLPFCNVESINVFGNPQISTQLVRECLLTNVPVGYYSEDGHYFGRAVSSDHVGPYYLVDCPYSPRGDGNRVMGRYSQPFSGLLIPLFPERGLKRADDSGDGVSHGG